MYNLKDKIGISMYDRSENVLVEEIKSFDFNKFNRMLVKEVTRVKLSDYYRVYKVNAYTANGHYEIILLDKGQLNVIQISQQDSTTCFFIDYNKSVQYRQEYIIDQIRTFIFVKYSLSGFQLTQASVNVFNSTITHYLILLAREDFKKITILVEETADKFVIKKIELLNDGMYVENSVNAKNV